MTPAPDPPEEGNLPIGAGIDTGDLLDFHERAVVATGRIVAAVRPDHLTLPTPCTDWDVRALLEHLVEANTIFARAASGPGSDAVPAVDAPAGAGGTTGPGPDATGLVAAYDESARAVIQAWRRPGVVEEMVPLPFGDLPGRLAVELHFGDNLVHGWDLARATGQDAELDEQLADAAYRLVTAAVDESARGPDGVFGPEVEWPSDAPVQERLVAFLGRAPLRSGHPGPPLRSGHAGPA